MNDGGKLLQAQLATAFLVLLTLPFGLLLAASRRAWLERAAAAAERTRTAALLAGAGVFLVGVALLALASRFPPLWPVLLVAGLGVAALFATGFAVGAWSQGRALAGRSGAGPFVAGWAARAGAFAVPVLGLVLGAYLVALSLGTPLVAWLSARKEMTEPSAGSTPAS